MIKTLDQSLNHIDQGLEQHVPFMNGVHLLRKPWELERI